MRDAPASPLRYRTPPAWAAEVLRDANALLGDHAHLERKAALNALELLNRGPGPCSPAEWVGALTQVARDESEHLHAVTRLLHARGGSLPRMHRNHYAVALHALVRRGAGTRELLDRLLVAALIEARSCERFELLAEVADDPDLRALYASLRGSERAHYTLFMKLAATLVPEAEVTARWEEMCMAEGETMAAQPAGPRIHSGS